MLDIRWLGLLAACARDPAPGAPSTGSTSSVLLPSCAANEAIPAVLHCTWSSTAAGAGFVEFWREADAAAVSATPQGPVSTTHDAAVLGLKAGETYEYRVVVQTPDTRIEGAIGQHVVPDVPADFPVLTLESVDLQRSELAGGYLLLAMAVFEPSRFTVIAIVDGEGDYVWWTRTGSEGLAIAPRFSRDGRSVRFLETDMTWSEDLGTIHRLSLDGTDAADTRALLGHHAVWENADGTLTWLGFDYQTFDGVDWASDALRTAPEGSGDDVPPTEEFSWFDAYQADPWEPDPGEALVSLGDGIEWTHSNSLMAIDDTSFYVMSKKLDCLLKIDRASGAIVWQLGGFFSDFTHPDGTAVWASLGDNDLFSHAHMSQLWDGGMVVFDNGDYHQPRVSSAVEYAFNEGGRTVEEVWRYEEPDGGHTASMGDVRKLAGGNYLVAWSSLGYASEVTPAGEVIWKLRMGSEGHFGRVTPLTDLFDPPGGAVP